MSTRTPAIDLSLDTHTLEAIKGLIEEAKAGRENDGQYTQIRLGDVVLDAYASKGWGVGFSRTIAGHTEKVDIDVKSLSVESVGAAIGRLVNL